MTSLISDLLARLDTERQYEFEERAGTIEFDSGVTRDEAEALALIDLLRTHPAALLDITALEIERDGESQIIADACSTGRPFVGATARTTRELSRELAQTLAHPQKAGGELHQLRLPIGTQADDLELPTAGID